MVTSPVTEIEVTSVMTVAGVEARGANRLPPFFYFLNRAADYVFDLAENHIKESEIKIDGMLLMPLCQKVRSAFDIPDNDET